jgi:hypothetical protein
MKLQNDAAKNSLWRSWTIITPRSGGSNSHHNMGRTPMTPPTSKRHQPIDFGQNNSESHNNFVAIGSKGIPNTIG